MKGRLIEFLAYLGIGQNKFEKNIGVSTGFINKVGDSIREVNLAKISEVYPELNLSWLKTGEGDMLKTPMVSQKIGRIDNRGAVAGYVQGNITTGSDRQNLAEIIAENDKLREENEALRESNQKLLDRVLKLTDRLLDKLN